MCYGGLRLGLYQPILGAVEGVRDGGARDGEGERPKEKTAQTRPAGFRVRTGGALEAAAKRLEHERREATERIREDSRARKHDVASKVTAGMVSGAFAAALLNPTELVKTRLMARNDVTTATEEARYERSRAGEGKGTTTHAREPLRKTPTAWSCARAIVNERGVVGLWRGAGMSVTRSAVLTASQCAAYDEAKTFVRENVSRNGEDDGAFTHFLASMLTGLITTTVTNPVDMIKTQLYMSAVSDTGSGVGSRGRGSGNGGGGGGGEKRDAAAKRVQSAIRGGAVAAFRDVLAREGPRGFMRGWTANYIRLGPQTVITFVALEQFRKLAGLTAV
jgi:solute carrier family 25 uncoupling protein 8/9